MSLHEMLSIKDPGILAYVPDYRLSLLAPGMMKDEEIRKLETSLREVLLYIKYSEDKEKLRKLIEEDERFHALEKEAILVISTVTETRFKVKKKEEKADMCKGMRDLIEDGRQEGLAQGIRMVVGNILKTGRYTLEELVEISGLTLEELKQMKAAQG